MASLGEHELELELELLEEELLEDELLEDELLEEEPLEIECWIPTPASASQ
jgi:hypothetical protein